MPLDRRAEAGVASGNGAYTAKIETLFPILDAKPLAPVDNLITGFVPDVARRIHVRVVRVAFVQRIINQVARSNSRQRNPARFQA